MKTPEQITNSLVKEFDKLNEIREQSLKLSREIIKSCSKSIRNVHRNDLAEAKTNLDEANNMKSLSEKKLEEYNIILENSKKEVIKILLESKNTLNKDIQNKKDSMEKEIEKEILNAQKEILQLKKSSIESINNISQDIASNIIEKMSGDKLNESSIKAVVEDISKKNIGKYL